MLQTRGYGAPVQDSRGSCPPRSLPKRVTAVTDLATPTAEVRDADPAGVRLVESFDAFYGREFRQVLGLAFVLCGSWDAAEDLAQDAFAGCYRRWDRVGALQDPGSWIRRVVANGATSRFRRLRTEQRLQHRLCGKTEHEDEPYDGDLWMAVRRLPRRQAQVVALRYVLGFGPTEISEVLGCSVETAKTHLARAKKALAKQLEAK